MRKATWFKHSFANLHSGLMLEDVEAGRVIKALAWYSKTGELPEGLSRRESLYFDELREELEESVAEYEATRERNRENARKRWEKQKDETAQPEERESGDEPTQRTQWGRIEPDPTPLRNDAEEKRGEENRREENRREDNRREERKPQAAPALAPPSRQDVVLFCQQQGLRLDVDQFINYYAAKNWMLGGDPIRDWRACVRSWVCRDKGRDRHPSARRQPAAAPKPDRYSAAAIQALMQEEGGASP